MATAHTQPKQTKQSIAGVDVTLTPLASTRDASFMIQVDDGSNSSSAPNDNRFANKLRAKTAILQSMSETRSVRTESTQSTAPVGEWHAGFASCVNCRSCRVSELLVLVCCPCIPASKIHGMLGSSFESGMLYFGGLVFAMLISMGLSCSNTSGTIASVSSGTDASHSHPPATGDNDRFVASDADPSTHSPDASAAEPLNAHIYGNLALVLLALFVVGVAFLRTKTRHRFNIPGSRTLDCVLSLACCWCVLSQTQHHIEKHNRYEFGLDTPPDTLPAYL